MLGERTAQGIMEHFNGALRKKLKKMGEEVPLQLVSGCGGCGKVGCGAGS